MSSTNSNETAAAPPSRVKFIVEKANDTYLRNGKLNLFFELICV